MVYNSDQTIVAYGITMSYKTYSRIRSYDFLNKVLKQLSLISKQVAMVSWVSGLYKYAK